MTPADETPEPGFAPAFDLILEREAPLVVGRLGTGGRRSNIAICGGTLTGEGISGRILGGEETLLERPDGVIVVKASYYFECEGSVLRAFGEGYRTHAPDFKGTRMTLLFEADEDGPLANAVAQAFVSEEPAESGSLSIYRIV